MGSDDGSNGKRRAKPPVKLACLACRASRIRCDGKSVCTSCAKKNRTCSYTRSKRGGPRVSRKKASCTQEHHPQHVQRSATTLDQDTSFIVDLLEQPLYDGFQVLDGFEDIVVPMISPGAGLKQLDSDGIFDSIFGPSPPDGCEPFRASVNGDSRLHANPRRPVVRAYKSDAEILNAYYVFIHPYFAILPRPEISPTYDSPSERRADDFMPSSPISLAVSAILALIPHPQDPDPQSEASVLERRNQAQLFAQLTLESIEIEAEVLASATSPAEALSSDPSAFHREPFHSSTPLELEGLLAYLVLSIYEYAQRGNLVKMRNRASQAYDAATRLSLHEDIDGANDGQFGEARRRAWWMTYVCVLQCSIVSGSAPIISLNFREFRTPLPSSATDGSAWAEFLDAQHCILKCTQYTFALKKALSMSSDLGPMQQRMLALNEEVDLLLEHRRSNSPLLSTTQMDCPEQALEASLRAQVEIKLNSCKIKLHRYRAFLDAPVFTQRHCDFEKVAGGRRSDSVTGCCSVPVFSDISRNTPQSQSSSSSESDQAVFPVWDTSRFDSRESARICMKAALAIGKGFEGLPYPNPARSVGSQFPPYLAYSSLSSAPRTMPAFACCAMQGSYALLMLCHQSYAMNRGAPANAAFYNGLEELYCGLGRILGALQNYSIAFEALDGMRSQIQEAFRSAKALQEHSKFPSPLCSWT